MGFSYSRGWVQVLAHPDKRMHFAVRHQRRPVFRTEFTIFVAMKLFANCVGSEQRIPYLPGFGRQKASFTACSHAGLTTVAASRACASARSERRDAADAADERIGNNGGGEAEATGGNEIVAGSAFG